MKLNLQLSAVAIDKYSEELLTASSTNNTNTRLIGVICKNSFTKGILNTVALLN